MAIDGGMAQQGSGTRDDRRDDDVVDGADEPTPVDPAGPAAPAAKAGRLTAILGVCTAFLTLMTAALGLLGGYLNSQKDQAEEQAAALASEVSGQTEQITSLQADRDALATEIDGLQQQRDALEEELEAATGGEGTPPESDPVSSNQIYLSDEQRLDAQRFTSGTGQVSGETYVHSLLGWQGYMSSSSDANEAYAEYDLGRGYETFTATIGLSDKNRNANRTVKFEVILDNQQIYEATLTTGEAEQLNLPVAGGLRLRLQLTFFRPEGAASADDQAVWGDAMLIRADA